MKLASLTLAVMLGLACLFPQQRTQAMPLESKALLTAFCLAAVPSYYGEQKRKPWRGAALGVLLGYVSCSILFPRAQDVDVLGAAVLGAVTGSFFAN